MTENTSEQPMSWQHKLFTMTVMQALGVNEALKGALPPAALAEVDAHVRSGRSDVAILIKHDGANLRVSVGLLATGSPELFETPLLRLNGPIDAAMEPAGAVSVTDLSKLN